MVRDLIDVLNLRDEFPQKNRIAELSNYPANGAVVILEKYHISDALSFQQ